MFKIFFYFFRAKIKKKIKINAASDNKGFTFIKFARLKSEN